VKACGRINAYPLKGRSRKNWRGQELIAGIEKRPHQVKVPFISGKFGKLFEKFSSKKAYTAPTHYLVKDANAYNFQLHILFKILQ
jgi:hypothetical protein